MPMLRSSIHPSHKGLGYRIRELQFCPSMRRILSGLVAIIGSLVLCRDGWAVDPVWRLNDRFEVRRLVRFEAGSRQVPPIVVVEFLGHGQLKAHAVNVAVFDHDGQVPWKVLQTGPGDFCRVAFQTSPKSAVYQIYYGGTETEQSPAWSGPNPLLLETRQWKECNLNSLTSVKSAFDAAEPLGSNFVDNVFHRWNPITSAPHPFLSHYTGTLQTPKVGNYLFFTSSEDASFLLIDEREVVAAPGRHGPSGQARIKGQVTLKAGTHRFDYWHAASGSSACMVAAWQPPGTEKPEVIPDSAFSSTSQTLLSTTEVRKRSGVLLPDFAFQSLGEVALADNEVPLIRVQFEDLSFPRKQPGTKVRWDFGDGQTSDQHDPPHVYLRAGGYSVKLTRRHDGRDAEVVNAIHVERPLILPDPKQPLDELAAYLPILDSYAPTRCDGPSLLQLVRAYEQQERWASGVTAGKAALKPDTPQFDDGSRYELAQRIGQIQRERLLDSVAAADTWSAAARVLLKSEWRARCEIEAADLLINELLQTAEAKKLIDIATRQLRNGAAPELLARLHRVRGDVLARQGDGKGARAAYELAARSLQDRRNEIAQNAWRGAHSRSVEAHLRDEALDAARQELDLWLAEFPADKVEGYLSLLQARYWVARKAWAPATAVASDLLTVNAASPYADQLVHLAAQCEQQLGHPERAVATYRSLLTDYPGSPLVDAVKNELARLEAGDASTNRSKKPK